MKNKTSIKKKASNGIKPIVIKSLPTEKEQASARIQWFDDWSLTEEYDDILGQDEAVRRGFNAGAEWMRKRLVGNV